MLTGEPPAHRDQTHVARARHPRDKVRHVVEIRARQQCVRIDAGVGRLSGEGLEPLPCGDMALLLLFANDLGKADQVVRDPVALGRDRHADSQGGELAPDRRRESNRRVDVRFAGWLGIAVEMKEQVAERHRVLQGLYDGGDQPCSH